MSRHPGTQTRLHKNFKAPIVVISILVRGQNNRPISFCQELMSQMENKKWLADPPLGDTARFKPGFRYLKNTSGIVSRSL